MAAPVVATTSAGTWSSNASSKAISKPTGLAVGDLMVAQITCINDPARTINVPTNWTAVSAQVDNTTSGSTVMSQRLVWKIADSGDVAASDFTFTLSASATFLNAAIARVTGANPNNTIDQNASGTTSNNESLSAAGVTPTYGDTLFFIFGSSFNGNGTASTYAVATSNPSWTEPYEVVGGSTQGIFMAHAARTQSTATGNFSFTGGGGPGTTDLIGHLVAIRPLVAATITQVAGSMTLTGGTQVIKLGVKIAQVAGSMLLTGGTQIIKRMSQWTNASKNSSDWTNINKSN